jgi:hypothetical protein
MLFDFAGFDPINAPFWTAVINGFLTRPLLVLVMLVGSDRRGMGERLNGRRLNVLGWGTTLVMFAAAQAGAPARRLGMVALRASELEERLRSTPTPRRLTCDGALR